jgi:hypothetical protein
MPTAMGYVWNTSNSPNGLQIYKLALNAFSSSDVRYGTGNGTVYFRIPSGYNRTGAYFRPYNETSNSFYFGLCTYDTGSDVVEVDGSNVYRYYDEQGSWLFVFYGDTKEAILYTNSDRFVIYTELLDPINLTPKGYMVLKTNNNTAVVTTPSDTVTGSVTPIYPDPIKVGSTVKVSRVYFFTPIGVATSRILYSGLRDRIRYNLNVQIGNRKFIQLSNLLVDVTNASEVQYYM